MSKKNPVVHSAKCGCFGISDKQKKHGKPTANRIVASTNTGTQYGNDSVTFIDDNK